MNKPNKTETFRNFKRFVELMRKIDNNKNESPGKLGDHFFSLRENILNSFSLPDIPEYSNIIENMKSETDFEKIYIELVYKAGEYLLADSHSRLQILKQGIKNKDDAFSVLPKINISTHVYTLFVYAIAIEVEGISPSEILKELDLASKHLNDLGILEQEYSDELYKKLKTVGLIFLDSFVEANEIDI